MTDIASTRRFGKRGRRATVVGAVSALVCLLWAIAFAGGFVNPRSGIAYVHQGIVGSGPPTGSRSAYARLAYGAAAPRLLRDALIQSHGPYRALLVVRFQDSTRSSGSLFYLQVLRATYEEQGLRVLLGSTSTPHISGPLATLPAGQDDLELTLLLDSTGIVKFAARNLLPPDQLRQLVEREMLGAARTQFRAPSLNADLWTARLRTAAVRERAKESRLVNLASLAMPEYLAVVQASGPPCQLATDLRRIRQWRESAMPAKTRLAVVVPSHYQDGAYRSLVDSLDIPVLLVDTPIATDMAYVTRASPAAAGVLLHIRNGIVRSVSSLADVPR